jgi:uncharacterized protein (TIGR02268 family)
MFAPALRAVWVVAFLCGTLAAAPAEAQGRTRHERKLVLSELPPGSMAELRVALKARTLLLFNANLVREAVVLEGREDFVRMEVAERAIVLEPGQDPKAGEPWILTVVFQGDGLSPSRVSFRLVVHPTEVDGEVQVERGAYSAEEQELRRQLDATLARCAVGDRAGLILSRVLAATRLKRRSFRGTITGREVTATPSHIWFVDAWTWVVFRVRVPEAGAPWAPEGAVWLRAVEEGRERVSPVWMEVERLGPGESGLVIVEVERAPGGAEELPHLEVKEKGGNRGVRIEESF